MALYTDTGIWSFYHMVPLFCVNPWIWMKALSDNAVQTRWLLMEQAIFMCDGRTTTHQDLVANEGGTALPVCMFCLCHCGLPQVSVIRWNVDVVCLYMSNPVMNACPHHDPTKCKQQINGCISKTDPLSIYDSNECRVIINMFALYLPVCLCTGINSSLYLVGRWDNILWCLMNQTLWISPVQTCILKLGIKKCQMPKIYPSFGFPD